MNRIKNLKGSKYNVNCCYAEPSTYYVSVLVRKVLMNVKTRKVSRDSIYWFFLTLGNGISISTGYYICPYIPKTKAHLHRFCLHACLKNLGLRNYQDTFLVKNNCSLIRIIQRHPKLINTSLWPENFWNLIIFT